MSTATIHQLRLFKDLTPAQYGILQRLFSPRYEPEGAVIFEQGELADSLYILVDGEIGIRYKPEDGPEIIIARVHPESVIGWSSALGNPFYTSTAVCLADCQMLSIRGSDLRQLCEKHPETGSLILERLAAGISQRLRNSHEHVLALLEQGLCININREIATPAEHPWVNPASDDVDPLDPGGSTMDNNNNPAAYTDQERLQALIEKISAYIEHFHGGSVEMVSYDGKVLKVRLGGACLGCPLSPNTLHGWVEGTVRQFFPNIEQVESVS
jgi:CRP/FNR family transcriptional regulator, cyclic AMP receptor protein